jgi:hypothetical protein
MPGSHFGTLRELLAVRTDPDSGSCRIHWKSGDDWRTEDQAPPYACTVTAFPDVEALQARLSAAADARDNATAHTASSSPYAMGPHVLLAVHLDRPMPPGSTYGEAVTHEYEGRGTLSHVIEGGAEAWTRYINPFTKSPSGYDWREAPGGTEVAWRAGSFAMWLDDDLEERLREILRPEGVRLVGDGTVAKVFAVAPTDAERVAEAFDRKLSPRLEAIRFAARSRAEARILMADPAVPRMLRKLTEGCIVLWCRNSFNAQGKSYQIRADGKTPTQVSGQRVGDLLRLGALKDLWEPADGAATPFPNKVWHLVGITDAGRALLAGDVSTGTAKAIVPSNWMTAPKPSPYLDAVAAFAAEIPEPKRMALATDFVFPKPVAVDAIIRSIGILDAMGTVLSGLISGRAVFLDDGRFRTLADDPPRKRKRATGGARPGP